MTPITTSVGQADHSSLKRRRARNILPSFTFDDIRKRARAGDKRFEGKFYLFRGDLNEGGSGRLYVSAEENPHLKFYEELLE